jgi:predicted dehydrogenase
MGEVQEVEFAHLRTRPTASVVVLDFGGFSATLETGSLSAGFWDEETKVYFQDGWVEVKTPPPLLRNVPAQVEIYKAGKQQEVLHPRTAWEWAFRKADEHFLECIMGKEEPRSSGKDALEDLKIMEAIFKRYLQTA